MAMRANGAGTEKRFVGTLTIIAVALALFSLFGCSPAAEVEDSLISLPHEISVGHVRLSYPDGYTDLQHEAQQVGRMGEASYSETTSSVSSENGLVVFVVAQCEGLSLADALTYWESVAENLQEEAGGSSRFPEIADAAQQADFRCEAPEPTTTDRHEGFAVRCTIGSGDSRLACEYRFVAVGNEVVGMVYAICPETLWGEQTEIIEAVLGSVRIE